MAKRLFVGGFPWETTDSDLTGMFSQFGDVTSVKVIIDRMSGRSKGFGFVEFANDEDADKAIAELNNSKMGERTIVVNVARPMEERSNDRPRYDNNRGGYGGGSRGGYGGGRGGFSRGDRGGGRGGFRRGDR